MRFDDADLAALDAAKEVRIETRRPDGPVHRTIVWIMVRDGDVLVRSYRGERGRWYREALANPDVAIHVDGRRLPARAVHAPDDVTVEAASEGLREKYRDDPALRWMLNDDVLPTTLRLEPVSA